MLTARETDGEANSYLPVRTRFFDDLIVANSSWASQVVLLGAGHDTRAVRLNVPNTVTFFALDRVEVLRPTEAVITAARADNLSSAAWPCRFDPGHPLQDRHYCRAGILCGTEHLDESMDDVNVDKDCRTSPASKAGGIGLALP